MKNKMNIQIISKKAKDLTDSEMKIMNKSRVEIWGKDAKVNFRKEDKKGEFIFVKNKNKIVAFGGMKPVKIKLGNQNFTILGIGRGMAIEKRKGWGKILNDVRIMELKKTGKTGIAFTGKHNVPFFEKVGYKIKKNGIRKFRYLNPKTKELVYDPDGEMVYYEGKDKFVTKLLKSKSLAITDTDFW
jgi:predicted N-acetyltransferase YhbS